MHVQARAGWDNHFKLNFVVEFCGQAGAGARFEGVRILGFGALDRAIPEANLEHLWVEPTAMRRGVGAALFAHAVKLARARGAQRLRIESDPYAESFYLRMGAQPVGAIAAPIDGAPERVIPVLDLAL
ncbi:MAG: GNAT family N-acetyltransferase [Oscillochloridaceae bacterium umkhey_bin13]